VVAPDHPIAKGLKDFTIPHTEIYTEPFEVPPPEAVIFEGTWPTGHRNREVLVWTVGKGRFVYIRPGHEEYPIFKMPEMQRLVANSVLWAAKKTSAPSNLCKARRRSSRNEDRSAKVIRLEFGHSVAKSYRRQTAPGGQGQALPLQSLSTMQHFATTLVGAGLVPARPVPEGRG
jgi:trehalose utilization protein